MQSLRDDDLPRFEARFKALLSKETINSMVAFQAHLQKRRHGIDVRIRTINESLAGIEYERVVITENEVSFLTVPPRASAMAIFGAGYAIDRLEAVRWLCERATWYWGDIDTHGFAILSRLRTFLPNVRSLLMDRETLDAHRNLWTEEPLDARTVVDLPGLEPAEAALYDDLRCDRLGVRIRLEQERIAFSVVNSAITTL